jgi:hypothetical protein
MSLLCVGRDDCEAAYLRVRPTAPNVLNHGRDDGLVTEILISHVT